MAPRHPDYVRLPERLLSGCVVDVNGGSGFSLSGLDVKPFPDEDDEPEAFQFALDAMKTQKIEEATEEEYNAVRKHADAVAKVAKLSMPTEHGGPVRPAPWNEAGIKTEANKRRRSLLKLRASGQDDSIEPDEEDNTGDDVASLTKAEIMAELRSSGVEFDHRQNKPKLADQLREVRSQAQ